MATSSDCFTNLVSSSIRGRLFSTAGARSRKTCVLSQLFRGESGLRSSGSPQILATTRSIVVLPFVVGPAISRQKFGALTMCRSGEANPAYSASRADGFERNRVIAPSHVHRSPLTSNPLAIWLSPSSPPWNTTSDVCSDVLMKDIPNRKPTPPFVSCQPSWWETDLRGI